MRALPLWLVAGCVPAASPTPTPTVCPQDRVGETTVLADGFESTEGVAFSPDGRLFVSAGDVVAEIQPDGSWQEVAPVPAGIGLAWWHDRLLVASSDAGADAALDAVWSVDVDAGTAEVLTALTGANFITVTPWDTLLVTDPGASGVLEVGDAAVSVWMEALESPNGTAFDADGGVLWSVTTFADPAPVWRIPVQDGAAGTPVQVASFGPGTASDGVAVGAGGDLYIAQNVAGRIDRVAADGQVSELTDEVPWAASAAFGVAPFEPCSMVVTSLFSDEVFLVRTAEPGLPPR